MTRLKKLSGKELYLVLVLFVLLLFSCGKRVRCRGTVYSDHLIPMPNQSMQFGIERGGKEQLDGLITILTDEKGRFDFQGRASNQKRFTTIFVDNQDSGRAEVSFQDGATDMKIILSR